MRSHWVLFIASLVMGAMGIISLAIGALAGLGATIVSITAPSAGSTAGAFAAPSSANDPTESTCRASGT